MDVCGAVWCLVKARGRAAVLALRRAGHLVGYVLHLQRRRPKQAIA
jgi:hypothetical protein